MKKEEGSIIDYSVNASDGKDDEGILPFLSHWLTLDFFRDHQTVAKVDRLSKEFAYKLLLDVVSNG